MYYNHKNNAQRAREEGFEDEDSIEVEETTNSGTKLKVTYYSDGSSTSHFGGPVGSTDYDENGDEC